MHDLEQDIRRILDEDGRDAPLMSSAPARVVRQVHRRQLRLGALASLCTVAIAIGLFAAFRAFTPPDGSVPGETGGTTHTGEIVSGSVSDLGSWWLTAGTGTADGVDELAFHVPDWSISMQVPPIPEGDSFGAMSYGSIEGPPDTQPGWFVAMGIVGPEASRVELRMDDGRRIDAHFAPMPEEAVGAPQAYVAVFRTTGDASSGVLPGGAIVAIDADGRELDIQDLVNPRMLENQQTAKSHLRNAYVAALTYYTDAAATFVGFTPQVAATIEPSLTYNEMQVAATDEVSIRDVSEHALVLVTKAEDGSLWCIAAQDVVSGATTYGVVDAQTVSQCTGGQAMWAVPRLSATPSPSSSPSSTPSSTPSSLHGIASGTDLGETWTLSGSLDDEQYCVQLETDNTGSGMCSAAAQGGPPPGPPDDRPARATSVRASLGELLVETVPNMVERIEVTASSGETYTGLCADPHLIPKLMSLGVRLCVVPLGGSGDGTMRFLTADGAQAFPSRSVSWTDAGSAGSTGSSGSNG